MFCVFYPLEFAIIVFWDYICRVKYVKLHFLPDMINIIRHQRHLDELIRSVGLLTNPTKLADTFKISRQDDLNNETVLMK